MISKDRGIANAMTSIIEYPELDTSTRTKTEYYPQLLDAKTAEIAYEFIRDNTQWIDGIYSRKKAKVSRQAYILNLDVEEQTIIDQYIMQLLQLCIGKMRDGEKYAIVGTYVNYYMDGTMFAPAHSHPKQVQLVLSLGATRTLIIGKKAYKLNSGDVIVFGGSQHEVPIEPEIKDGRISIATFMLRLK